MRRTKSSKFRQPPTKKMKQSSRAYNAGKISIAKYIGRGR